MFTENESVRLIFGLKVRALRQQKNLSYQQLATQTGVSLSYLHDIETGKKYPKADKIIALAKALGADYDYLVSLHASKKLQPIIDLINSDLLNVIPWEHFGLTPAGLLELFANTPDKVTAFISTLFKISRSYQLSKEGFYNAALRSYQDLQDNYFGDIEEAVREYRSTQKIKNVLPVNIGVLENLLNRYGVGVNRKRMSNLDALRKLRSYYSIKDKTLYLNKGLSEAQEKFLLGREIGFHCLKIEDRPYETKVLQSDSFDMLLNNFKASYFAVSLLMPEEYFVEDIKRITMESKWNDKEWLEICTRYDVTPEMMMQRLTNVLPKHFGIDQLFFLRMSGRPEKGEYEMTKELHLSQLHNPYANALHEHYCRRWISIHSLRQVSTLVKNKKYRQPLVLAQISQYWNTHNRYFCLSIAKPAAKGSDEMVSVTIGLMIDLQLLKTMPFINDPSIPGRTVHTTCERCGIKDCKERAIKAVEIEKSEEQERIGKGLMLLDEKE